MYGFHRSELMSACTGVYLRVGVGRVVSEKERLGEMWGWGWRCERERARARAIERERKCVCERERESREKRDVREREEGEAREREIDKERWREIQRGRERDPQQQREGGGAPVEFEGGGEGVAVADQRHIRLPHVTAAAWGTCRT